MKEFVISKTRYLAGLQCLKLLWHHFHDKSKFPPLDSHTQAIFDQGHEVTAMAQTLFPGGIEIKGHEDYDAILRKTQELLPKRKPLFEPAFSAKNIFARSDILNPNKDGSWGIYEVKSSTQTKDVHLPDLAFQKYCYESAGLKIKKCHLILVNNQYVRRGKIDPKQLLSIEDVTEEVVPHFVQVAKNIKTMLKVLAEKSCPDIKIGSQCSAPYQCPLTDHCWKFLPEENVFILSRMDKKRGFALIESKVLNLKDVPETFKLTDNQRIQWQAHRSGKPHKDLDEIKGFLAQLKFPIYFLDFETVNPAIPFYDLSRPYQNVPFQFSLHILPGWGKKTEHHGYLAAGTEDPRPELMDRLKKLIGPKGTVLSYNMSFELARIKECAEAFPEYQPWVDGIVTRFMDLIVPFRSFYYYDPKQMGSTSIKYVYPALTSGHYEGLEIADGGMASLQFARITFRDGISEEEKAKVRNGLETYCKLDTQAMIDVLQVLKEAVEVK